MSKTIVRVIAVCIFILPKVVVCAESEPEILNEPFVIWNANKKDYKDITISIKKRELIGKYEITAYCPCIYCCGKSNGITASGVQATANHTIAADLNQFSFGDKVIIGDCKYVVEDSGGAIRGNKIDMFFSSHSEALNYGRRWENLYREYEEEIVLKEIPFYEYMMITIDLSNNRMITAKNSEDGSVEWTNQAGDLLVYRKRNDDSGFRNYVEESIYIDWVRRIRR